jgi:hypothetical protein
MEDLVPYYPWLAYGETSSDGPEGRYAARELSVRHVVRRSQPRERYVRRARKSKAPESGYSIRRLLWA